LPLVVEQRNDDFRTLLDSEKLEACGGDYETFLTVLEAEVSDAALAASDSSAPAINALNT
jgi:hypothetical protein